MKKFIFVKTKGLSVDQSIQNMHKTLTEMNDNPEIAGLEIHSMSFHNSMEMPPESKISSLQQPQPIMVVNCCVMLIERTDIQPYIDLFKKAMDKLFPVVSDDSAGPTDKEKKDILSAAKMFCQHTHLDPAKHSKANKNPGHYFQYCEDCGAEVWNMESAGGLSGGLSPLTGGLG